MKISVITITYHDGELLRRAIDSVYAQRLPEGVELEHIMVSSDTDIAEKDVYSHAAASGSIIIETAPKGCYNALNQGIRRASGDIIGMLHGSDMYAGTDSLARVAEVFEKENYDFIYGDVKYIKASSPQVERRYYNARSFVPKLMMSGIAPPHPSLYIKKSVLDKVGLYNEDYITGADFDLFARLFFGPVSYNYGYLPGALTAMELGGLSTTLYNTLVVNTREKMRALRKNGLPASPFKILSRYIWHLKRQ